MAIGLGPAEVAHGPLFIGFVFNVTLFGVLTGQVHHYFDTYRQDRTWMKGLVYLIYLMNIVNTVFMAEYLYNSLILHFDDPQYLTRANWVFSTDPAMTGIISFCVQAFFTWRVKVLTSSKWPALLILSLSLTSITGSLATAVNVTRHPVFTQFSVFKVKSVFVSPVCHPDTPPCRNGCFCGYLEQLSAMFLLRSSSSYICEILLPIVSVYYLTIVGRRKHKTGFKTSDQLVDRIIRLTVQTGLITTVCAIVDAIMYLVDPTGTHLIFNLPLAKLYSVTLLSSLNSREGWAFNSSNYSDSVSRSMTGGIRTGRTHKKTEVHISTTTTPEVFVEARSISTMTWKEVMAIPREMRATVAVDAAGEAVDDAARDLMSQQDKATLKAGLYCGIPAASLTRMTWSWTLRLGEQPSCSPRVILTEQ
ncbi:hypothetical protein GYMLUDRAFT_252678 [Collybiopsis luxurians FD-317 M1]|uniref:DUF6534 domain-containing protein n=1 Tax=Collybiopsis luxurians FD-317 M1 TaxID=944289 RepID=A0A0D0BMR2_9AGAR|nr:hypothetical protein GYMLUDRAFT_252678 [Collybiopsis luxurians FD-317 M1]